MSPANAAPRPEAVQEALSELAARLVIPADLISVHRSQPGRARTRRHQSIRYGAFLLAYGPFERFFNSLIEQHGGPSQGLSPLPDKLRQKFRDGLGVADLTRSWRARARVSPGALSADRRWRWTTIQGQPLRDYLADAKRLRNLLAHGGDPKAGSNTSGTLHPLSNGGFSINLMWVEGFLQVVEDLSSITAIELVGPDVPLPTWPEPVRSGVSARLPLAPY